MTDVIDLDDIIKALAHPTRREMLHCLKDPAQNFQNQTHSFEFGVCASQFERCGLSQSTVSAHLAVLERARLITRKKVGQWNFFARNEVAIAAFLAQMQHEL